MSLAQSVDNIPHQRWLRIIPPAIMVYIFSYMDRANIGYVMAAGKMSKEIHMTAQSAGMAAGILFIGYLFLQIPGGHIAAKGRAKLFIAVAVFVWGAAATLSGFVRTPGELMILRFVLGVAEGGTFPAMLVLLANWFPPEERARANAFFMCSNSLAYIITGPVSGWLINNWGWRYVFVVEGLVTMVLAFIFYPLVHDRPEQAKWLSAAERDYLVGRAKQEEESLKLMKNAPVSYKAILSSWNLWKLGIIYFCFQVGVTGYVIWLPTIIKTLTKTGMTATGFLSGIPYIAAMAGVYIFARASDRSGNRRLWVALAGLGFSIVFFLSTQTPGMIWVSYSFLVCCGFFTQAHNGVFWTIPPQLFSKEIAGGARGIINGIGNLGGFLGPFMVGWFITTFHSQKLGLYGLASFLLIACFLSLTLPASVSKRRSTQVEVAREAVLKS